MKENQLEKLQKSLKEIKQKFNDLKNSGIDMEILEIYLMKKTKLSKQKVREFIKNEDEFFNKLISDEVLDKL